MFCRELPAEFDDLAFTEVIIKCIDVLFTIFSDVYGTVTVIRTKLAFFAIGRIKHLNVSEAGASQKAGDVPELSQ